MIGQGKRNHYEFDHEIPVYIDSIQASLSYPLSWRNLKGEMSFDQWRSKARDKVLELMGPVPPMPDQWDVKTIAEERRNGYVAKKIEFNLSRWYRVSAYGVTNGVAVLAAAASIYSIR